MTPIRVFFKKTGRLKYISHLDLMRAVTRGLIRSDLDISYSEGFNPHPKLVFALPLSLFQESEFDIFDFAIENEIPVSDVAEILRKAFPKELIIIKTASPVHKLKELAFASYEIRLKTSLTAENISKAMSGEMIVSKKTKAKTMTQLDIKPMIKEFEVMEKDGEILLTVAVSAAPQTILNPAYIVSFFGDSIEDSQITRIGLHTADGKVFE